MEPLHTLGIDEVLARLNTSPGGLSDDEAGRRLAQFGPNEVSRKRPSTVIQFLAHFKNPLVIILLIAAAISVFVGEITSAAIIIFIILASVCLDFYQEYRAGNAVELLKQKITTTSTVVRGGAKKELPISRLVPGDIILLSAGDIVPADARILSSRDFFVNQSALTGEPYPVEKTNAPPKPTDQPAERDNTIFQGTSVVSGSATAVVTKTGTTTEFGRIAQTLVQRPPETEFERGLNAFGLLMMRLVFFLVIFVFFVNALLKHDILESLLFAVALAVGMTPELLPMILTINLSKGAISMSEKGAIVKHLASIQNFGSMDILCTDKTGTLTENRISLVQYIDPHGNESDRVLLYSFLNSYHQTGLKSPLDTAILSFRDLDISGYQKVDEIPFDFIRKRVSIVVRTGTDQVLIAKGAPEEILKVCSSCEEGGRLVPLGGELEQDILGHYTALSSQGFRTLGVAYRPVEAGRAQYTIGDESEMTFLGFVAFIDPPKATAGESLRLLHEAGIEVKILSGDNELVTKKTCESLGYEVKGVLTGPEIALMDDEALARVVEKNNIFTRVTPIQKDRILLALKKNGHVVGFLGDGINDAPSIRTADVGISVDNAVDIAKESADIILLRNDLRVLLDGVREGRKTFGNTLKYIMMGTSSNFGNMFSVAGASLILPFLPMLPIQILLNNFLYDFSQTTIPTDAVDDEYTQRPKRLSIDFIRRFIVIFGPISSIFDYITFFILLVVFNATGALFQTAWFIESICTQVAVVFVIRTRKVPFTKSRPSGYLIAGTALVIAISCILPFTVAGSLFGFVPPPLSFFGVLFVLVVVYLLLVELVKGWFYRHYSALIDTAPQNQKNP
jgi:Mg2+-importing ATPase